MAKSDAAQRRRKASRLYATQALFQMEASATPLDRILDEFETHRFGAELDGDTYEEGDPKRFREIVNEAFNHQSRIDQLTDAALVAKWPIDRIDPTLRAIFRACGAELVAMETPPKVAISEYVDIAAAFFPEGKEARFVNAVLDHMARAAKPEAFGG